MRIYFSFLSIILALLVSMTVSGGNSFKDQQKRYPRVRNARAHTKAVRDSLFKKANVDYPPQQLFIRAFKHEQQLEVWARDDTTAEFVHIKTYPFTDYCGTLGPKRVEGDRQIPEGFYDIDWYNPASSYLLSMRVSYPNKSDWKRAAVKDNPGGSIFIHGDQVTIGCIPIGDFGIEELYIMCVDTRSEGQEKIPVHIFPCRMTKENDKEVLQPYIDRKPALTSFWDELRPGYEYFERHHRLPTVSIDDAGEYHLSL